MSLVRPIRQDLWRIPPRGTIYAPADHWRSRLIGSNLAKLALANDVQVTILDDLSTGYRENVDGLDVTFIEGSILDAVRHVAVPLCDRA